MKRNTLIKWIIVVVVALLATVACSPDAGGGPSQASESKAVENQQQVYLRDQPIPQFDFSLERDIMIQLYQLRNEAASTYTVVVDSHGGEIYSCPSIGYPLAADMQLTNPDTYLDDPNGTMDAGSLIMPQPEPNGLFSSTNTVGTWVMCVLSDGSVYPYYTEMNAQTWPFPVQRVWKDTGNGTGYFTYQPADGAKPAKTITIKK